MNMVKTSYMVKRGQVWLVDLGEGVGSEQWGVRPFLIIQNEIGNKYSPTVMGAPLTTKSKNKIPTHVSIEEYFLKEPSIVMLEQIRTIDKVRLIKYMGKADDVLMIEIDEAIRVQTAIKKEFDCNKAYSMLQQINKINKTIKKFGEDNELVSILNFTIHSYIDYCNEHKIDYKEINRQYKDMLMKNRNMYEIM